jgi:hypothetical protein
MVNAFNSAQSAKKEDDAAIAALDVPASCCTAPLFLTTTVCCHAY